MKKLNSLLLSAILIAVYSLPAMAAEDQGISVIQATPAESTGSIAPSAAAGGAGALSTTQLLLIGLGVVAVASAVGGGSSGGSSATGTRL